MRDREEFIKEIGGPLLVGGIEESMGRECERIRQILRKMEGGGGEGIRKEKGWWDEECVQSKRKIRRELRNWRNGADREEKVGEGSGGGENRRAGVESSQQK